MENKSKDEDKQMLCKVKKKKTLPSNLYMLLPFDWKC